MDNKRDNTTDIVSEKRPSLFVSLVPVAILIALIVVGAIVFGDELTDGPSQIALLGAAAVGALIGIYHLKIPWEKLEGGMLDNLSKTGSAIFIILMIGALTAAWIQSGVVPTMIYYGLKIINPSIFLLITFLFTGIISCILGSSWTTVGTIGLAMLTIGRVLGYDDGWLAGAILSGAYVGDKISPLSDTTNLSSSISGVKLSEHIKYMVITNVPAFIICAVVFGIAGFFVEIESSLDVEQQCREISGEYNVSLWLLLIPAGTIFMIYKKISPFLTLCLSAIIGVVVALFAQPQIIQQISPYGESLTSYIYAPIKILSSSVDVETDNKILDGLVDTGGMGGMIKTIWLVISVVGFGGIMESAGYIECITRHIMKYIKSTVSLVAATVGSCCFCNILLSDQYISILVSGKMFGDLYDKGGYERRLLARSIQDSATVTSVLVPWNTCGVYHSGMLGIPTLTLLPYCVFNYISPLCSIAVAAIGYKIYRFGKRIR